METRAAGTARTIQEVRSTSTLPIIVISARTLERSKVAALDLGADDYLTKPFGTAELLARIRTALRHSQRAAGTQSLKYEAGDLLIDFERRLVKVKGQDVHLTQIEYKLVCYNSLNRNTELHSHYERSDIAEAPRHLHHSGLVRRQFFPGPPA